MNILVTGDAGILGSNLVVHRLVQSNEPVILTNKPEVTLAKFAVHGLTSSPRTVDLFGKPAWLYATFRQGISPDTHRLLAISCSL